MAHSFCPFSLVLFAGLAVCSVSSLRRRRRGSSADGGDAKSASANSHGDGRRFRVVFVLGGPGAGKGTQCDLLRERLGWSHLSAGDLLRAERRKAGSDLAGVINSNIAAGRIVPSEITCSLIHTAMVELRASEGRTGFLIDGFPRSEGNVAAWDEVVGDDADVESVLFFECPEDVLTSRLLERAKTSGRADDTIDVIRKRFAVYKEESMPIINMYEREGKVHKIIADRPIEEVYKEVEALLSKSPVI